MCVNLNHNAPDPNLGGVKNQEKIYLFNGQHSVVETGAGPYLVVHMSMIISSRLFILFLSILLWFT